MNRKSYITAIAGRSRKLAVCAVVTALLAAALGGTAVGADEGQVWLIDTRGATRSGQLESAVQHVNYRRLQPDRRWLEVDRTEFFRSHDRPLPTTIFIHGNRTSHSTAVGYGWQAYRRLERMAEGRPFRFVIWSWPSDRVRGGARHDVRVKACRSDAQSYYLAECLQHLDPDVPVSLIGYSFGARIITGALHLLGGGELAGRSLAQPARVLADGVKQVPPRRAVLVAAALDANWLLPGRPNELALSQVQRLLVTRNVRDPVLKWYPRMYRHGGPQALGFVGPATCLSDEKVELLDLSCSVGRVHDWGRYWAATGLRRRLAWYTFLDPPEM